MQIRLVVPTAEGMPLKNTNWHKPCGGKISVEELEEAGIKLPGLEDDHVSCTRQPHPSGLTLHVSHGTQACLVWGSDTAQLDLVMRRAIIRSTEGAKVARYLPSNYEVIGATPAPDYFTIIEGYDSLGWTLDDYVLPRLASGMFYGEEVTR